MQKVYYFVRAYLNERNIYLIVPRLWNKRYENQILEFFFQQVMHDQSNAIYTSI